ncbi:sugar phosphate isomerase/epimerase family protein [Lutibacter citreus]|uniref:sugar phosphate isomerase/epimerase family protein n=1 Tax=Lutibacter citreus TaxID=2138210 RepID=UPI001300A720|nr:TIM barrel protein [Lutibacter citreus]
MKNGAEKLGWTLSVHTVSFSEKNTIEKSLDSIKAIGLTQVDTYRGNQYVGGDIDTLHYWLDKKKLDKVKMLFKDKGVELNHFGVIQGEDEKEWREIFEFAKYMGVKMLISEPQYEHLKLVDKLSQEYGIPVGIHNHPAPTKYWHPNTFMTYAKNLKLSKNIGIYPDINNWVYSGLNPVEMLKLCEGRIIGIQIKDHIDGIGMVQWGTGTVNVPGIFHELKRQNFKGNISFEYFGDFSKVDYISKSIDYLNFFSKQFNK